MGTVSRRDFVKRGAVAGAGLVLGVHLPLDELFAARTGAASGSTAGAGGAAAFEPNAWIKIATDGVVSIVVDEAEMGQGTSTGIPRMIADEMEADWSTVVLGATPTDPSSWPRTISTGGSTSIRHGWEPLRKAGAAAREMLKSAAAATWGVDAGQVRAEKGRIHGPGGRSLSYGELTEKAATLPVPEDPPLKPISELRLVGRSTPRLDLPGKVDGSTVFGTDFRIDGMVYASLALPPAFGARVRGFDDAAARRVSGVQNVVQTDHGVAVLANNSWSAMKGRDALQVDWDRSGASTISTAEMSRASAEMAGRAGEPVESAGNADGALASAATRIEVDFELPFLDHAPMEPLNATALVKRDGSVEVWVPTQVATAAQRAAARVAGVEVERVKLNMMLIGGGFGRRLQTDDTEMAVAIAAKVPGTPVQLLLTREDTTRHGTYRPYTYHRMWGGLDANGRVVAWKHRLVGAGSQGLVTHGATPIPYGIANQHVDAHVGDWNVPTGALRSVGYTQNGFTVEAFMDELAVAAGKDPYQFRRDHMSDDRLRNVLDMVAERSGWGSSLGEGRGRGIAAVASFGSWVAQVAEVTVVDNRVTVDRIVCVADCGIVINPDAIESQVEGGAAFGLTHALKGSITLENGGVREGNFTDYPLLTMREMPVVETHIVESAEAPGGIGEPGVPPVAPAVANAIYAATGRRVRKLPVRMNELGTV